WLVTLAWIAAAVAAIALLPALSSVTQSNNTKFLPASAPAEKAAQLAAPFGTANLLPLPVVAVRTGAPLTSADAAALTALQPKLASVPTVRRVTDVGRSADGQAEQLLVLATQGGGNPNQNLDLVNALRAKIAHAGLPAGLQVHLAGDVAVAVDQQKATGNTGNKVQYLSMVFIIVLLLGAGTDYGLFRVFRAREELRAAQHERAGDYYPGSSHLGGSVLRDLASSRPPARQALVRSVTR